MALLTHFCLMLSRACDLACCLTLLHTILVKSCRESCVHHVTSHLIPLFELLAVLFGKWLLCPPPPPPPPIQCWDCSWGSSWKISHHIFPRKSNIDKGEGVISKAMLPSQHLSRIIAWELTCCSFLLSL